MLIVRKNRKVNIMSNYSGKTTSYHHKWNNTPNPPDVKDCIQKVTLFDVQWSNCPIEVETEVRKLWNNWELGNDYYYAEWNHEEMKDDYPLIAEYLSLRGVSGKCLIHWWW